MAIERLNRIKVSNTPGVIVCVYGNMDFYEALIELRDIVCANGLFLSQLCPAAVISSESSQKTYKNICFRTALY